MPAVRPCRTGRLRKHPGRSCGAPSKSVCSAPSSPFPRVSRPAEAPSSTLAGALMALPGRDCYTAAKGGIASMTQSMAVAYAPHNIRVNAIAPSVALTERVKRLLAGNANVSKLAASHLLGLGQPIHIANMAVYLASDEAAITTGQILSVDSGVTIY